VLTISYNGVCSLNSANVIVCGGIAATSPPPKANQFVVLSPSMKAGAVIPPGARRAAPRAQGPAARQPAGCRPACRRCNLARQDAQQQQPQPKGTLPLPAAHQPPAPNPGPAAGSLFLLKSVSSGLYCATAAAAAKGGASQVLSVGSGAGAGYTTSAASRGIDLMAAGDTIIM
jgi:hypothetical protein